MSVRHLDLINQKNDRIYFRTQIIPNSEQNKYIEGCEKQETKEISPQPLDLELAEKGSESEYRETHYGNVT